MINKEKQSVSKVIQVRKRKVLDMTLLQCHMFGEVDHKRDESDVPYGSYNRHMDCRTIISIVTL